ncbi:hypothetical protein AAMO2058_001120900 [Amorphochlora amoebiformis]
MSLVLPPSKSPSEKIENLILLHSGWPSRGHADYASETSGDDALTIPSSEKGAIVNITVHARGPFTRVSVVATFDSSSELLDGVPQQGRAEEGEVKYYTFTVGVDVTEVIFAFAYIYGTSTMYVSKHGPPNVNDRNSYEYKSNWLWHIPHVISRDQTGRWADKGIFYVAMQANTDASFVLQARSNDHIHRLLRAGISISDSIQSRKYHYYKFQNDNPGCNLTFQLTPISGDPDLYVSMTNPFPNTTSSTWFSKRFSLRQDAVTIPNSKRGVYYVSIFSFRNTSFSILAMEAYHNTTSAVSVTDGIPIQGSLSRGEFRLYQFRVHSAYSEVSFSVTALGGDPDLYISRYRFVDSSKAEIAETTYGNDFISIKTNTTYACHHCDYFILVKAAATTSYSLVVTVGHGTVILRDGIAVVEDIERRNFEYFQVRLDDASADLTVAVTDLTQGDPDLYISTTNTHPNKTSYMWKAQSLGADAITITNTDPLACTHCTYFIAVYAYTATRMSIVATWGRPTALADGDPQSGSVAKHQMRYYVLTMYGNHDDVSIRVATLSGMMDMYVSETEKPIRGNHSTYQFFRPYTLASKSVMIRANQNSHCTNRDDRSICVYYVGIWGHSKSEFTITASSGNATTSLQNGVPLHDHVVAYKYEYFKVDVLEPNMTLSIILTPIIGDPDLYTSIVYHHPQRGQPPDKTRVSRSRGGDNIFYDTTPVGSVYIGVYGYRYSEFTIKALVEPANDTASHGLSRILDGQPQSVMLRSHQWAYFIMTLQDPTSELTATVSRVVGDPDLYIRHNEKPTMRVWDKRSNRFGSDFLAVRNPILGEYYIGVFAYKACRFTLTVASRNVTRVMQDGIPIQELVNKRETLEFIYNFHDLTRDVSFILTPISGAGDPDLSVTVSSHTYTARSWMEDSITIDHSTLRSLCQGLVDRCHASVKIYGYTASLFSITALSSNSTVLADGVPQAGSLHHGQYAYYHFECKPEREISIVATPTRGKVMLYANHGTSSPSYNRHDYKATTHGSVQMLRLVAKRGGACNDTGSGSNNCVFTIAVLGNSRIFNSTQLSVYSLVARSTEFITVLRQGVPLRGWARRHSELFYRFDVPTAGQNLLIEVTKITGDPDLYISSHVTHPTRHNYERHSLHIGSDAVIISHANKTSYYIGVYAFKNSTYTIMAQMIDPNDTSSQILIDGSPQTGIVAHGERVQYQFYLASITTVTFSLTVQVGDPDLNVTQITTGKSFVANRYGTDIVMIHNAKPGRYQVVVYGYTDALYTLSATTIEEGRMLSDGIAIRGSLQRRDYDFYSIYVDRTDRDLTVSVTPFNGDPDLYISRMTRHPSNLNHTYAALMFGEDSITIPKTGLKHGTYYISVFAPLGNCSYSILATFSNQTMLEDGVPQAASLHAEAGLYYLFMSPQRHTKLIFTLSFYRGLGDMFISNIGTPTPYVHTSYQWRTHSTSRITLVEINLSDPHYHPGDRFNVLVHCYSNCSYSVTARSALAVSQLQSGITQSQWGLTNENLLFSFDLSNSNDALEVAVNPMSGSVDLKVSTSSINGPWQFSANGLSPLIDVPRTDPRRRLGIYYIRVHVRSNATFSITAFAYDPIAAHNHTGSRLQDGVPMLGLVRSSSYRYYRFFLTSFSDVSLTVTPRYGNPDMYVSLDGVLPGKDHYRFKASTRGDDQIVLQGSDISTACGGLFTRCEIKIAIYGATKTLFSLTATSYGKITFLEPGQTYTGTVESHSLREFAVFIDSPSDLLIDVVPISSGDPDLYLASYPHPNTTHYEYRRVRIGRDSIAIRSSKAIYYYISVYGYRRTTFRMTVALESAPVTLVGGEVQNGFVRKGHGRQYIYHVQRTHPTAQTNLMLHAFNGNVFMYVSANTTHPSATDHQFSTEGAGTGQQRGIITIPTSDSRACDRCILYINVVGVQDSMFSLLGTSGDASLLVFSQPMRGTVGDGMTNVLYYEFLVDNTTMADTGPKDVSLVVSTFSGMVAMYVARSTLTTTPGPEMYEYKNTDLSNYKAIDLPHSSPGVYYVAIEAEIPQLESHFQITVSTDNIMLRIGTPHSGRLSASGSLFFCHTSVEHDVLITAQPLGTTQSMLFKIYVSTNSTHPTEDNHEFGTVVQSGTPLRVPMTERKACQLQTSESCVLYINVIPYSVNDFGRVFEITASTSESIAVLPAHSTTQGDISPSETEWKYYETYVEKSASRFFVKLNPCVGDTNLYIDSHAFKPTVETSTWRSDFNDRSDQVLITNSREFGSSFYIGVNVPSGSDIDSASFQLKARIESPGTTGAPRVTPIDPTVTVSQDGEYSARVKFQTSGLEIKSITTISSLTIYWIDTILLHQQPDVIPYTACGLLEGYKRYAYKRKLVTAPLTGDEVLDSIEDLSPGSEYIVNVVATLDGAEDEEIAYEMARYKHFGYAPNNPKGKGVPSNIAWIVLGIGIPLLIIFLGLILVLWRKNRRLTRELEVEVNICNISHTKQWR